METRYATVHALAPAASADAPQITPTRRSLDNRFPQLAFTIQTRGKPYFEVLLTTDRALFAAGRAADRTLANFYPGRVEDRQLLPALDGSALFIVPQAVLHAFASANPRPRAIFYTVVSYTDTAGNQPTVAQASDMLTSDAPSVLLSADFRAETLSTVLGIPVSRLRRYQVEAGSPPDSIAGPGRETTGESTTNVASSLEVSTSTPDGPQDGYEYYHQAEPPAAGVQSVAHDSSAINVWDTSQTDEDDYPDDDLGELHATAQQSPFPYDMPEPAALQDAEEPGPALSTPDDADGFTYDDGFGEIQPARATVTVSSGSGHAAVPASFIADGGRGAEPDEMPGYEAGEHSAHGNGKNRYRDEADEYAYEESFAAEEEDIFLPELPYESLSATSLGGGAVTTQPLTIDAQRALIEQIAGFESGRDRYSAMNRDGEFRGLFGQNHSAYNRYHIGLSYGIVQFTQDSGNLGRLLTMMRTRDQARFNAIFGPDAEALIRVTTAVGPSAAQLAGGRSARVQPVGEADLWEEPWVGRFAQAGQHVPFQAAQNELAAQLFITPMLPFARWLDLTTDRALAIVVDRAVQMGVGGARAWIIRVVGSIPTPAQRQQALAALGHADLRSFQRVTPGLTDDGDWGPQTHAALVAALRSLGPSSPVEIPTRNQMLAAMVRQSAGESWGHRVQTLHNSSSFQDTVYDF